MGLRLITPPAEEPITLEEAKQHLRVEHAAHDLLIGLYIQAAREHIDGKDGWLGRAIVSQTWELSLDTFPTNEIQIPLPPLSTVSFVQYDDEDGFEQTIDAADYTLDPAGWVVTAGDYSWPSTLSAINAVRVRFVAGYGDAADVPATIKAAILLMVGDLYAQRESFATGPASAVPMSTTVENLLAPLRVWSL